jgi:hypothetical protein
MTLIKIIESNIFATGRYWGRLNSLVYGNEKVSYMSTGIDVADLNWVWNERPLEKKDTDLVRGIKNKYQKLKLPFWWWVYPSGKSKSTKEILQKEGFSILESIPCLALDLQKATLDRQMNENIKTVFVQDQSKLKKWEEISFQGFEMPGKTKKQYNRFVAAFDLGKQSPQKLFLAYWKNQPVATALIYLRGDTAGIYFVTTLASYRDKGIALCLIMDMIKYMQKESYRYCVLQSSKEGLNMYLQAGFKEYCKSDVYALPE